MFIRASSVPARVRPNPSLAPDLSRLRDEEYRAGLLARWDLMDPLYRAFEQGAGGGSASMALPPSRWCAPPISRTPPSSSSSRCFSLIGFLGFDCFVRTLEI